MTSVDSRLERTGVRILEKGHVKHENPLEEIRGERRKEEEEAREVCKDHRAIPLVKPQ